MEDQTERAQLPTLVIDGPNVCLAYAGHETDKLKGLQLVLAYFTQKGWSKDSLIVIFPSGGWQGRVKKKGDQLLQAATFVYVPQRRRGKGEKEGGEDDDLFAIQTAQEHHPSFLVTNDRFRNHQANWAQKLGKEHA
jgi:hypothetical protein